MDLEITQIESLKQRAYEIKRLGREIDQLEKEISTLNMDLSVSGSLLTLDEVQAEYEAAEAERYLYANRNQIRSKLDRAERANKVGETTLQQKQNRLRDLKEQELKMEFSLQECDKLTATVKEYELEVLNLQKQIDEVEVQTGAYPARIRQVEVRLSDHQKKAQEKEDTFLSMLQKVSESMNQIAASQGDIMKYIYDDIDEKVTQCQQKIEQYSKEIDGVNNTLIVLETESEELSKTKADYSIIQRNVKDNIQLRKHQRQIQSLDQKEISLKKQISTHDQLGLENDYGTLKEEHARLVGEVQNA